MVALLVGRQRVGWMVVALLVGRERDGWMVALLVGRELDRNHCWLNERRKVG